MWKTRTPVRSSGRVTPLLSSGRRAFRARSRRAEADCLQRLVVRRPDLELDRRAGSNPRTGGARQAELQPRMCRLGQFRYPIEPAHPYDPEPVG